MKHVLIALAVVGGLSACSRGEGEPEAVLEEFARIAETGRCERVPELITKASRDMMGALLETACKTGMEQRKKDPSQADKKIKRINVLEKTENGDKTTVRAEPEFEDGSKEAAANFVMAKEDGAWKIDLLATSQAMMGAGGNPHGGGAPAGAPGGGAGGNRPGGAPAGAPAAAPGGAPGGAAPPK